MNKHIIYLAAGNSRRFGRNKLLAVFQGKPLYRHGLDMLSDFCKNRRDCTLTVISQYEEILEQARANGICAIPSPDSKKGMSYTMKAAINSLNNLQQEDFLLFVVADQPYLTAQTIKRLTEAAACGVEAASVAYGDRPGNPAMFSARLIPELLALEGDEGGRKILKNHPCIYVQVEKEQELYDVDTPQKIR